MDMFNVEAAAIYAYSASMFAEPTTCEDREAPSAAINEVMYSFRGLLLVDAIAAVEALCERKESVNF